MPAVVIGAGQAGLSTSYCLKQHGVEHAVLERGRVADAWASHRWDSFRLNTPNWTMKLPGAPYAGKDPDGFLPRDEIVAHLESYAHAFDLPVHAGVDVTGLKPLPGGAGWALQTGAGRIEARNVVVAAGAFPEPRVLPSSRDISPRVLQLHTSSYRNSAQLPRGAVLVVGSGQSGVQVAEDLADAGRKVYISVGSCHRAPRRYRGRDIFVWLNETGFFDQARADLPARARLACNPQITGKGAGHDIDVWRLARTGAALVGRFVSGHGEHVTVADDLAASLALAEQTSRKMLDDVDAYITREGLEAPPAAPIARDFSLPAAPRVTDLDLGALQISAIVWATGFRPSYPWIEGCAFDSDGFPITQRGVTDSPGLYFVGTHLLHKRKSGLFLGVGEDAAHVAQHVAARK